tara:strand:- start:467 stop:955 length:489 start_codon:yes stop_codon:yes gene_type:complete
MKGINKLFEVIINLYIHMNSTLRNYNFINYNLSIIEFNLSSPNESFNYDYYYEYETKQGWKIFSNQTNTSALSRESTLIPSKTRLICFNKNCYAYIPNTSSKMDIEKYMFMKELSQKYRSQNSMHSYCVELFVQQHKMSGPFKNTIKKSLQYINSLLGKVLC